MPINGGLDLMIFMTSLNTSKCHAKTQDEVYDRRHEELEIGF